MTSAVESVIKMINKRVKGSEKFWSEPGAEAILQLRADYLGETETMSRFWSNAKPRPAAIAPTGAPPEHPSLQTMSCAPAASGRMRWPGPSTATGPA